MGSNEPTGWITVNGKHIPLGAGETKEEAIKKAFGNKSTANAKSSSSDDKKKAEISKSKAQADKLNAEKQSAEQGKYREVPHEQFSKDVADAKSTCANSCKWRVDVHTPKEYGEKGAKCYVTDKGSTVAVTDKGDIISVCRNGNETERGVGQQLLAKAVKQGGTKLDSFAGNHKFYVKCGFEPVAWTPFNRRYKPEGWMGGVHKTEPVIFYKYVGVGKVKQTSIRKFLRYTQPFRGEDGYDNAYAYRDKQIK